MSFQRTLDEIPSDELVRELSLRHYNRMSSLRCPYCKDKLKDEDGGILTTNSHKPGPCRCRFSDVDTYHSPHVLNPLQYGE